MTSDDEAKVASFSAAENAFLAVLKTKPKLLNTTQQTENDLREELKRRIKATG